MTSEEKRPLKVFLCHASGDKPLVRELYKRLIAEGVDAWLDQEKLLPGQDWRVEIPRAVREADAVVICLSNKSITKEGYVQKEIKFALDSAEEKAEDTIFLIPARLEDCVVPERLGRWQWVDLFEENGFVRLLRSLKLRADAVGASMEPLEYENEDQDTERRLDQLYIEGLAAFYTEDWDKASRRFQAILRERPNHKNAAEKLAQADRQKILEKLYAQAMEALQVEDWQASIQALEELLRKSAEYKDAAHLLREAKKQKQLRELYTEARRLHAAQKWQAVVKVFEQIATIEPAYPDPETLLSSAQKEVAELKRLTELNELYKQGIHKIDAGQWYEARGLLEQVHKAQTGFLDTERLLRKVEDEIIRIEERRERENQISTLYEQAHGLIRSKSWRLALVKKEEIEKLDNQFMDKDGIFEKAKNELVQEEQIAQRQNEVAALYAEAVRLLKEGKYQEALDKWQDVRALDSKYPDRQRVQSIASRKLTELGKPVRNRHRLVITQPLWAGLMGLIAMGVIALGLVLLSRGNEEIPPLLTATSGANTISARTKTAVPVDTNTTQASTSVSTAIVQADPLMYDDFDNSTYEGKVNTSLWNVDLLAGKIFQQNGLLAFELSNYEGQIGISTPKPYKPVSPIFVESKIMLDRTSRNATIWVGFGSSAMGKGVACSIFASPDEKQGGCTSELELPDIPQEWYLANMPLGIWHIIRVELYPNTMIFVFFVDGKKIGSYVPKDPGKFTNTSYVPLVYVSTGKDSASRVTGYVDYFKLGKIEESEIKQTAYHWDFGNDSQGWGADLSHAISPLKVSDGYLTFKSTAFDPYISSPHPLKIYASTTPIITIRMRCTPGQISDWNVYFLTNKDEVGDEKKRVDFSVKNSGIFETYNIRMSTNPAWRDIITEFRLDLPDSATNVQAEIDYISVHAP
jgi:outer membrane protein assembly factor BamD (BamD/ComL family)